MKCAQTPVNSEDTASCSTICFLPMALKLRGRLLASLLGPGGLSHSRVAAPRRLQIMDLCLCT